MGLTNPPANPARPRAELAMPHIAAKTLAKQIGDVRFVIDDHDADAREFKPGDGVTPSPGVPTGPRSRR